MTAPVDSAQFQLPGADTPAQAAAMWRGALLDRFARLETTALRCIVSLNAGTRVKPASYVTWQRFDQLREAISGAEFAAVSKKTIALLDAIEEERELRTALAHGVVQARQSGVVVTWHAWREGRWVETSIRRSWLEVLDALTRIDKLRRDFGSQLGQVRKLLENPLP